MDENEVVTYEHLIDAQDEAAMLAAQEVDEMDFASPEVASIIASY